MKRIGRLWSKRNVAILAVWAPALLLLSIGCQSFNSPPSNNLASLSITNRTMELLNDIRAQPGE